MSDLGRYLMIIGLALVAVGTIIWLMPKVPWLESSPEISLLNGKISPFTSPWGLAYLSVLY